MIREYRVAYRPQVGTISLSNDSCLNTHPSIELLFVGGLSLGFREAKVVIIGSRFAGQW
mgnify:CR=1 FL=1